MTGTQRVLTEQRERLGLSSDVTAGPAIARQRRRSYLVWAIVALLGLVPILVGAQGYPAEVAVGLVFPGSGFLAAGAWWWTVLTLVVFGASLAGWLGVGGFVFPVGVWLGSAFLAATGSGDPTQGDAVLVGVVLALVLAARATVGLLLARRRRASAVKLHEHLGQLAVRTPPLSTPPARELTEEDLACARYVFDRALQPIGEFAGFTTIDQFRESAWRYQLVSINYALASLQLTSAPAFRGYLLEAQANAVTKMLDRRVWHYWRIENLIGNLKVGADPVRRENIMLSGWWALALGAFEGATGDRRFSAPGALTFVESENRSYEYDVPLLVDTLAQQFDEREFCFFPCEPNWVFAICNLFGLTGMLALDRAHGTTRGRDRLERFAEVLEREYTTSDGRFVMISSRRAGLRVASASAISPSSISWLTNMVSPRLAQTYWEIGKRRLSEGGPLESYDVALADAVDPGNYRPNSTYFWAALMLSARELGDEETYAAAAQRLDANGRATEGGVTAYKGSTYANLTAHVARLGSEGLWHRLAWGDGDGTSTGPHLAEASYPDVLVARAVSDGDALDLVLRPGARPASNTVSVAGLRPLGGYRVRTTGAGPVEATADATGQVAIDIRLAGRTEVRVEPVI